MQKGSRQKEEKGIDTGASHDSRDRLSDCLATEENDRRKGKTEWNHKSKGDSTTKAMPHFV